MLDILVILLCLVLFFFLNESLVVIINDVLSVSPDSTISWMLRAFPFFILFGIIKYVSSFIGGTEQ